MAPFPETVQTPFFIVVFTFAWAGSVEKNSARKPAVKSNNKWK